MKAVPKKRKWREWKENPWKCTLPSITYEADIFLQAAKWKSWPAYTAQSDSQQGKHTTTASHRIKKIRGCGRPPPAAAASSRRPPGTSSH